MFRGLGAQRRSRQRHRRLQQWDGRGIRCGRRGASGVWELFIPGLEQGNLYKFEIKTRYQGYMAVKSDPFGFCGGAASQQSPQSSGISTLSVARR